MTDTQRLLRGFSWLQTTTSKEEGISSFWRRFHKSPDTVIESTIGNTQCWYLGPIITIEAKGESDDGTITRQAKA